MKMQKAHCAVLRIKDCLSYRLGQALIDYDKNGGGALSFNQKALSY